MNNNLIHPMQMRVNHIEIQEFLNFLEAHPDDTSHNPHITQDREEFMIPFAFRGVVS